MGGGKLLPFWREQRPLVRRPDRVGPRGGGRTHQTDHLRVITCVLLGRPGPERGPLGYVETLHGGVQSNPPGPTQSGANGEVTRRAKDGRKPSDGQRMPGAGLSWTPCWEDPV
jgi:hypothetical protein